MSFCDVSTLVNARQFMHILFQLQANSSRSRPKQILVQVSWWNIVLLIMGILKYHNNYRCQVEIFEMFFLVYGSYGVISIAFHYWISEWGWINTQSSISIKQEKCGCSFKFSAKCALKQDSKLACFQWWKKQYLIQRWKQSS